MKNKKFLARTVTFIVACLMLIGAAIPSFAAEKTIRISSLNEGDKILTGETLVNDTGGHRAVCFGYVTEGASTIIKKSYRLGLSYSFCDYNRMMRFYNGNTYTFGDNYKNNINGDGVWMVLQKDDTVLVLGTSKPNSGGIVSMGW